MTLSEAEAFINTIYLGDRACKGYSLDSFKREFRIFIDDISRIRSTTGEWNYYIDEDIKDGRLVFSGLVAIHVQPSFLIPNDYVEITRLGTDHGNITFELELGCVGDDRKSRPQLITIVAADFYLEDPEYPGVQIR